LKVFANKRTGKKNLFSFSSVCYLHESKREENFGGKRKKKNLKKSLFQGEKNFLLYIYLHLMQKEGSFNLRSQ